MPMILIVSVTCSPQYIQSSFYVIFRIPIYQAGLGIHPVFAKLIIIAETQIQIITFLRPQIYFTGFQVFITKQFVCRRKPKSLFIRKFYLKIFP